MIGVRMLRLIEKHSAELADGVVQKVRASERTRGFQQVPEVELKQAVQDVFSNLGEWLLTKTDSDIELRYRAVGERRAKMDIPLAELVWALQLTKEHIWAFLQREAMGEGITEIYGELELLQLLNHFYDRAIYYATLGYEGQLPNRAAA